MTNRSSWLPALLLCGLCSLVAGYPFFHGGFYQGHDLSFELTRAADYAATLRESGFPVRWSPNLESGYGLPIYLFFPPLSLLLFSIPILLGCPLVTALKIVLFSLSVAGGFGMYCFARRHFGSRGGMLAAGLYVLAPYHFIDIFSRNALAEFTALSVAPFLFAGLGAMVQEERPGAGAKFLLLGSAVCFALSHVLSLLMYLPLAGLYLLVNLPQPRWPRFLAEAAVPLALSAGLAAFYLLPLFWELQYVQTWQLTVGRFDVLSNFVTLAELLGWEAWFSVTPFPALLLVAGAAVVLRKWPGLARLQRLNIGLFATYLLLCVFMMTESSAALWRHGGFLKNFQFPWRLLSPATFALCFLSGALGMGLAAKPVKQRLLGATILLLAAVTLLARFPVSGDDFVEVAELAPSEIRADGLRATVMDEYLPVWVKEKPPAELAGRLLSSAPGAVIENIGQAPERRRFRVVLPQAATLTAQSYYFPGWQLSVDERETPFSVNAQGLPQFRLPSGAHRVELRFGNTWDRFVADAISLLALLALVVCSWKWLGGRGWPYPSGP